MNQKVIGWLVGWLVWGFRLRILVLGFRVSDLGPKPYTDTSPTAAARRAEGFEPSPCDSSRPLSGLGCRLPKTVDYEKALLLGVDETSRGEYNSFRFLSVGGQRSKPQQTTEAYEFSSFWHEDDDGKESMRPDLVSWPILGSSRIKPFGTKVSATM